MALSQSEHLALRQQLGLPPAPNSGAKPDISTTNLEFLRMENDKLHADRVRQAMGKRLASSAQPGTKDRLRVHTTTSNAWRLNGLAC